MFGTRRKMEGNIKNILSLSKTLGITFPNLSVFALNGHWMFVLGNR